MIAFGYAFVVFGGLWGQLVCYANPTFVHSGVISYIFLPMLSRIRAKDLSL